jgi:hypothetical protein
MNNYLGYFSLILKKQVSILSKELTHETDKDYKHDLSNQKVINQLLDLLIINHQ